MTNEKIVYVAKKPVKKKPPPLDKNKNTYVMKKQTTTNNKTKIPQVRVILPLYIKLLIIFLWMFIIIVVVMMWNAINLFRVFRQWWKNNDGQKYNKVFSINLLAQYENFSLGYFLYGLFVPVPAKIESNGVAQFLINTISSYALLSDQDDQDHYFMMPYHMCENIAVGVLDNSSIHLPDTDSTDFDDKYGWPNSPSVWRKLLHYWGVPNSAGEDTKDSDKLWQRDGNQNFLWHKYNLNWQTPFILAFMWNQSTDPDQGGTKWYEQAFLSAVGLNNITIENVGYYGGWWGMVKYGFESEKDLSFAEIIRILYSEQKYPPPDRNSCNGAARGIGYGTSIASGLIAAAGILAFIPSGGSSAIAAGAIVSGLLTAGSSAFQTAQKCGDIK